MSLLYLSEVALHSKLRFTIRYKDEQIPLASLVHDKRWDISLAQFAIELYVPVSEAWHVKNSRSGGNHWLPCTRNRGNHYSVRDVSCPGL